MSDKKNTAPKTAKTAMDRTFLSIAQQLMANHSIPSERAMSTELGQNVNFMSRIRTGVQSVPADVWGVLISRFNLKSFTIVDDDAPATYNVSRITNVVGTNTGTATQTNHYGISECEKERDTYKIERDQARQQVEHLQAQLATKDALIASKEETIDLLKASLNRSN